MTRRNDKRNNRHYRQHNNKTEFSPFASMLFGALISKGTEMIAKKMAEEAKKTPDIHAEGISNQDVTNINNGKASLTKCTTPTDGTAVELPIPDNLQVFISEDGKPMIRKKIEGDEEKEAPDAWEGKPITYDDICKELFLRKKIYWPYKGGVDTDKASPSNYKDVDNCTSEAQVKRLNAFNKLQNIAKYLNKGWKPDFDNTLQEKFYIAYTGDEPESDFEVDLLKGYSVYSKIDEPAYESSIYFETFNLACEAIRLMGKDSLNDLFNKDW